MSFPVGSVRILSFQIVDFNGLGVTGQSPTVSVRRTSDGRYFNGTAFQVAFISLPMTELDSVNIPGVYVRTFDQALDNREETYFIHYVNSAGTVTTNVEELDFSDQGLRTIDIPVLSRQDRPGSSLIGTSSFFGPVGHFVPIP